MHVVAWWMVCIGVIGTVDLSSSDAAKELLILYLNTISHPPFPTDITNHPTTQPTTPTTCMPNVGDHPHADPSPNIPQLQHNPPHLFSIFQILSSLHPILREPFFQNCESHGFQTAIE